MGIFLKLVCIWVMVGDISVISVFLDLLYKILQIIILFHADNKICTIKYVVSKRCKEIYRENDRYHAECFITYCYSGDKNVHDI